jgi:hypothetical protein
MVETSLLRGVLKEQSFEKGGNWLSKIEKELNGLLVGDI